MKIRIKGNSVRYRLSKSDVDALTEEGYIEEQTYFGSALFKYALERKVDAAELSATYTNHKITVYMPQWFLKDWAINNIITIKNNMPVGENESLFLLVEKDFKCLDHTDEDQSDNYDNPNKTC
jgi:hypothetical protein